MKKTLLLSVVASTMMMAGGDIKAPVEPVVETPAPAPMADKCSGCGDVTGNIKIWYGTDDRGVNDLFNKNGAFGDAYADIKYSRKLSDAITLNAGMGYLTTLGLENELVSATWAGHGKNGVGDAAWINEANFVLSMGSTFAKVGRQELDTPFFYSEKWNIATNTFDAVVVGNTALPSTTLVAAWVGRGNGAPVSTVSVANTDFGGGHIAFGGKQNKPAYAFAAINKSITNTALQAWYYQIPGVANAYWLQADTNVAGLDLGAQYAGTKLTVTGVKTNAFAVKLGYTMSGLNVYGAYSQRDNTANGIDIANIATGHTSGSESKLYTEAYWNYGYVGGQDAQAFALGASYDLGAAQLGAHYTNVNTGLAGSKGDLSEFALTASTKVGPLNADLAYVNSTPDNKASANTVLVMISAPFSL